MLVFRSLTWTCTTIRTQRKRYARKGADPSTVSTFALILPAIGRLCESASTHSPSSMPICTHADIEGTRGQHGCLEYLARGQKRASGYPQWPAIICMNAMLAKMASQSNIQPHGFFSSPSWHQAQTSETHDTTAIASRFFWFHLTSSMNE